MRWRRPVLAACAVGALTALAPGGAVGQDAAGSACAYDDCALRVRFGFFGQTLVRGGDEELVRNLGFWIGDLDEVNASRDPLSRAVWAYNRTLIR